MNTEEKAFVMRGSQEDLCGRQKFNVPQPMKEPHYPRMKMTLIACHTCFNHDRTQKQVTVAQRCVHARVHVLQLFH